MFLIFTLVKSCCLVSKEIWFLSNLALAVPQVLSCLAFNISTWVPNFLSILVMLVNKSILYLTALTVKPVSILALYVFLAITLTSLLLSVCCCTLSLNTWTCSPNDCTWGLEAWALNGWGCKSTIVGSPTAESLPVLTWLVVIVTDLLRILLILLIILLNLPLALSVQLIVNDLFGIFLLITLFILAVALSVQSILNLLSDIFKPLTLLTTLLALSVQFIVNFLLGITLLANWERVLRTAPPFVQVTTTFIALEEGALVTLFIVELALSWQFIVTVTDLLPILAILFILDVALSWQFIVTVTVLFPILVMLFILDVALSWQSTFICIVLSCLAIIFSNTGVALSLHVTLISTFSVFLFNPNLDNISPTVSFNETSILILTFLFPSLVKSSTSFFASLTFSFPYTLTSVIAWPFTSNWPFSFLVNFNWSPFFTVTSVIAWPFTSNWPFSLIAIGNWSLPLTEILVTALPSTSNWPLLTLASAILSWPFTNKVTVPFLLTAKLSTSFFTFSAPEVSPSIFALAVPSLPSTSSTSFFTFSPPEVSPSIFVLAVPSLPSTLSTSFSTFSAPEVSPSTSALAVPFLLPTLSTSFSTFSAPEVSPSTFILGLLSFSSVLFNSSNILSIVSSTSCLPSISTPGLHMYSPIICNCSLNVLAFLRASSIPSNCNIAVAVFPPKASTIFSNISTFSTPYVCAYIIVLISFGNSLTLFWIFSNSPSPLTPILYLSFISSGIAFIADSTLSFSLKYWEASAIKSTLACFPSICSTAVIMLLTWSEVSNPSACMAILTLVVDIESIASFNALAFWLSSSSPVSPIFKPSKDIPNWSANDINSLISDDVNSIPPISIVLFTSHVPSITWFIASIVLCSNLPLSFISVSQANTNFSSTSVTSPSFVTASIIVLSCLGKSSLSFCSTNQSTLTLPCISYWPSNSVSKFWSSLNWDSNFLANESPCCNFAVEEP